MEYEKQVLDTQNELTLDPSKTLEEHLNDIEKELLDVINDSAVSGYESHAVQDIAYGVTVTAGINPAIDTVLDIGCGVSELYYYAYRFTGSKLFKYIGVDTNQNLLDIAKFRSNQDDSVMLYNLDVEDIANTYNGFSEDALKNLQVIGFDNKIDWVTCCNYDVSEKSNDFIKNFILFWSKIPEKAAVFTLKFEDITKKINVISDLISDKSLEGKLIIRSDFMENWVSFYIYNVRE